MVVGISGRKLAQDDGTTTNDPTMGPDGDGDADNNMAMGGRKLSEFQLDWCATASSCIARLPSMLIKAASRLPLLA